MKCTALQRWLLNAEDPARVPAEVREHLHECASCRQLQQRLVAVEQHVAHLPVPPSTGRADFVQQFLTPPAPVVLRSAPAPSARPWRYLAAAAAAAVFLAFTGLILFALRPRAEPSAEPVPVTARPLLDSVLERDLRLARATSPRERVEALAELAGDLHGEAELLAPEAGADDLGALADLYSRVVREGLVPGARSLPAGERRDVLGPIVRRLSETADAADRRARQAPASSAALLAIARTARQGDGELRRMLREERP